MTELERKIAAKIPGEDTGIIVKKTFCDICTPLMHCGVDAYVKDGKVIKVEGTSGHPLNNGLLCTKGANNRAYLYREDRILRPLKRVGPRGSARFENISWEEAYGLIAENLQRAKSTYGPNSVAFFSGYEKWYRFMLQRFAYKFGSVNYGTESSACFTASRMAWLLLTGKMARPDIANTDLFLGWATASYYSRYLAPKGMEKPRERGGRVIIVEPRITHTTQQLADLHLRVTPGTDGLLANCIAGVIIGSNWHDKEYIERHVHGFDGYAAHVCSLDIRTVSRVTGVLPEDILRAADWIAHSKSMAVENNPTSLIHQTNGLQTVRAIFSLSVITGNYDKAGGNLPVDFTFCEQGAGFTTRDEEFSEECAPADFSSRVGAARFPVWAELIPQMQAVDLARQIREGTPYPIRCVFAHGMNHRIFPAPEKTLEALSSLDFFVDIDPFMTDTALYADIVLPACTSMEREEFKVYPGGYAAYYLPAVSPMGEARSDARILQELAVRLDLDDEYLKDGYRACIEHVIEGTGLEIGSLAKEPLPVKASAFRPYLPGEYLKHHLKTRSGKLELFSETIASVDPALKLRPLPEYEAPACKPSAEYPFILLTGVRIPNAIHSRLHNVPWARSLRPEPAADISVSDAERLGIRKGDDIGIFNQYGSVTVKANPTCTVNPGQVYLFHGYREADAAVLISSDHVDPYSGFPGFKTGSCNIRKTEASIR